MKTHEHRDPDRDVVRAASWKCTVAVSAGDGEQRAGEDQEDRLGRVHGGGDATPGPCLKAPRPHRKRRAPPHSSAARPTRQRRSGPTKIDAFASGRGPPPGAARPACRAGCRARGRGSARRRARRTAAHIGADDARRSRPGRPDRRTPPRAATPSCLRRPREARGSSPAGTLCDEAGRHAVPGAVEVAAAVAELVRGHELEGGRRAAPGSIRASVASASGLPRIDSTSLQRPSTKASASGGSAGRRLRLDDDVERHARGLGVGDDRPAAAQPAQLGRAEVSGHGTGPRPTPARPLRRRLSTREAP